MAETDAVVDALPAAGVEVLAGPTYDVITSGAGNGTNYNFSSATFLVLYNDSGTTRIYTIKIEVPSIVSDAGATVVDSTVSVLNGKVHLVPLKNLYAGTDGKVTIECDGAGKVLAYSAAK